MVPAPFIVVIDANVLFPLTLRDTVLRAAAAGFYQLRWSREILDEMQRNLVEMLREQAADLQNPPVTLEELIDMLVRTVPDLAAAVKEYAKTHEES